MSVQLPTKVVMSADCAGASTRVDGAHAVVSAASRRTDSFILMLPANRGKGHIVRALTAATASHAAIATPITTIAIRTVLCDTRWAMRELK